MSYIDRLQTCMDTLRVLAKQSDNLNSEALTGKRINEFVHGEVPGGRAPIQRLAQAIEIADAEKREGEDWTIAKRYVRSLLQTVSEKK